MCAHTAAVVDVPDFFKYFDVYQANVCKSFFLRCFLRRGGIIFTFNNILQCVGPTMLKTMSRQLGSLCCETFTAKGIGGQISTLEMKALFK